MTKLSNLISVNMDLRDVLYISYRVPLTRVRPLVPSVLPLASIDGSVFVSLIAMQCRRVHLSVLKWPSFNYDQLNMRTYVTDPETGKPAVYFFRSGVSSRIIPIATRIAGVPWQHISFDLYMEGAGTDNVKKYKASGYWAGNIDIEMETSADNKLDAETVEHVTGPMAGFIGSGNNLKRIDIEHKNLEVRRLSLSHIKFRLPIDAGILEESELESPDSVLMIPLSRFTIHI
jgi:hypothetical protein